ncbi:hypothetical protein PALB_22330 [Pseudoalteromonas luteoviolacea B = ATCC 29581]|nr:hypothetical protein PALB_22330 [Pseudoalteromonas luteoviolacea B = ATCC 29581]
MRCYSAKMIQLGTIIRRYSAKLNKKIAITVKNSRIKLMA